MSLAPAVRASGAARPDGRFQRLKRHSNFLDFRISVVGAALPSDLTLGASSATVSHSTQRAAGPR